MTFRLHTARPGPSPAPPGGPAGRYLTSPGGYTGHLARLLLAALAHYGPAAGPLLAAAVTAVIAGRAWLRRRQHAAFTADARTVTILAPPQAGPDGAAALWGHLTGLLRPPWARLWHGQPHLGWEYTWAGGTAAGMVIRMWVPGTLPPGLTERAIEAAWPGTHTITSAASPPLPPGALTEGGALRLARPEILPLSVSHDPDAPLRALAGAAAGLGDGEHAIVQVLARPVTGARLRRARRAARAQRAGQPARLPVRLLDLASPGGHASSGTRRTASRTDPELAAEIRAATEKLASPQWETLIRYGVATTAAQIPDGAGRWQARAATAQANARLRGLAHALASATALYTGRNWLARRHLRHPAEAISTRRLPRGDLLSVPELAAIARLPADPALPGLARAGARAVAPPPAIPLPGPDVRPLGVSRHRHAPPGRPGRRRRPSPPADLRADRNRQDHPDRRADPVRCHGRARRGVHRPQRRRRHRHHRPPPRAGGGQGGAVRPRGPRRAALPERPARRRVRHRHRRDHRQRHRHLPPHLRLLLGAAHR